MKIGIIGSGLIVSELLKEMDNLADILEIVTITSRIESFELNKKKYAHLGIRVCSSYDEMLKIKSIDTIYIAIPNHLHYEYSMKALKSKKHVICEKPFTPTRNEAIKLKNEAINQGCMIFEAVTTLYSRQYHEIKEIIDIGEIGEIKIVECNYSQYSRRYDQFKKGNILPVFDKEQYGGALMDINSYNVHFVIGLFGEPESLSYHANIVQGIDTSGVLLLKYPSFISVCTGAKDCRSNSHVYIQGNDGTISVESSSNVVASYNLTKSDVIIKSTKESIEGSKLENEFRFFNQCIQENDYDTFISQINHSIIVMDILERARKSIE